MARTTIFGAISSQKVRTSHTLKQEFGSHIKYKRFACTYKKNANFANGTFYRCFQAGSINIMYKHRENRHLGKLKSTNILYVTVSLLI